METLAIVFVVLFAIPAYLGADRHRKSFLWIATSSIAVGIVGWTLLFAKLTRLLPLHPYLLALISGIALLVSFGLFLGLFVRWITQCLSR